LVKVVQRASSQLDIAFQVTDGVRTVERQRELFLKGASRTMKSKHLPQDDGLGYAVDLVPLVDGKLSWDWERIYPIATAMIDAASYEGAHTLVWGGVWDRPLHSLNDPKHEVALYVQRRRAAGKDAFIDGPHYQVGA
jgi:peptidoglycan LD-endopeptidase CwlK